MTDSPAPLAAADVTRGLCRLLLRHELTPLAEVPLDGGRRADVMALDPRGAVTIIEIKVSRADLLGELRKPAKSAAYRALCGQCWFVLKAGIAQPEEIPPEYGVLIGHDAHLELARPAPKRPHKPDFATWLALARATPERWPDEDPQSSL